MARDLGAIGAYKPPASSGRDLGAVGSMPLAAATLPAAQPTPPAAQTGSAGQAVIPGSSLGANLKALPGQLLGAGKALFNTVTGSEQAAGQDIAGALQPHIGISPSTQMNATGSGVIPTPRIPASVANPALAKSNAQILGDFGGVAGDALSAGTYSKAGLMGNKALTTGLERATPTAITAGKAGLRAAESAVTSTPEQIALKDTAKIVDTVSPKLTAQETAQALASRGGTKSGLLGKISLNTDPAVTRIADTVKQYVPDFKPSGSLVENIAATRKATDTVANALKDAVVQSGQDRIYSFKELNKTLQSLPKPTLLVGDLEQVYGRVVDKAMEIARSNGGKVSDLFQARKEFDDFVRHEFPNLYSSDTLTPMRTAIKSVRNAMTDFTAEHLPEDVALHDKLTVQSRLLDAIQNMSAKAASGADKEVGTNALTRFAKQHPTATRVGGGAVTALGVDKVVKDATGFGI